MGTVKKMTENKNGTQAQENIGMCPKAACYATKDPSKQKKVSLACGHDRKPAQGINTQ
jgi:hypothetical protein